MADEQAILLPATFTDLAGREWRLALNVLLCRSIRDTTGVDLLGSNDGQAFQTFAANMEKFVEALWIVVEAQAKAANVTPDEFAAGLGGDVLAAAKEALDDALVNFSHPARRAALQAMREQFRIVMQREADVVQAKVQSPIVAELISRKVHDAEKKFDAEMRKAIAGN